MACGMADEWRPKDRRGALQYGMERRVSYKVAWCVMECVGCGNAALTWHGTEDSTAVASSLNTQLLPTTRLEHSSSLSKIARSGSTSAKTRCGQQGENAGGPPTPQAPSRLYELRDSLRIVQPLATSAAGANEELAARTQSGVLSKSLSLGDWRGLLTDGAAGAAIPALAAELAGAAERPEHSDEGERLRSNPAAHIRWFSSSRTSSPTLVLFVGGASMEPACGGDACGGEDCSGGDCGACGRDELANEATAGLSATYCCRLGNGPEVRVRFEQ